MIRELQMRREERGFYKLLLLTYTAIGVIVCLAVLLIKYSGYGPDFAALLSVNEASYAGYVYEVRKASENLPVSRGPVETISLSQIAELRKMLQEEKFEELNAVLEELQDRFVKDQTDEYRVYDAYQAFEITDPSYEPLFAKWIEATKDKYPPYMAAAQYYHALGWESRGYKWAKDTPAEQMDKMVEYFHEAAGYAERAVELNPDLMVAHEILINIYNAGGSREDENMTIDRSLKLFPLSFLIRSACLWAKEPRWGGSYAIMEEIAKRSEICSEANPRLTARGSNGLSKI